MFALNLKFTLVRVFAYLRFYFIITLSISILSAVTVEAAAGPLGCARSFIGSPHHFDSEEYKLRPLVASLRKFTSVCIFPVLSVFDIRGNSQERNSRV
jgi:hypothetical protein